MKGLISEQRTRWLAGNVLQHEPALRRWLGRHVPAGVEPDDVVQEAYALIAAQDDLEHIQNPRAYLFTVARSVVLKHVRRARIVSIDASADIERLYQEPDERTPERYAGASQELRRVGRMIAELPDKCRQAFVMCKVEQLPQDEIARRMGLSRSSVEKLIAKALHLLMDKIAQSAAATAAPPCDEDLRDGIDAEAQ